MKYLIIITLIFAQRSIGSIPQINVLVGKSLNQVKIKGLNLKRKFLGSGNEKKYKGLKTVTFNCDSKPKSLKNKELLASLKADNNLIKWGDNLYQGELLVTSSPEKKSCDIVMKTSINKYISLLLSKEMSPSWPLEALKAQAIAARTYALLKIKNSAGKNFDLENSEKHQVNGTLKDESKNTIKAAMETKDLVLVHKSGEIQPIFYHAKCGGKTLLPSEVWGGHLIGYKSVICPYCEKHGKKRWNSKLASDKLTKLLDRMYTKKHGRIFASNQKSMLYSFKDHIFNRKGKIFLRGKTQSYSKPSLRSIAGRKLFPSNNYEVSIKGQTAYVQGRGLGHGVGLCQLGALEMAKRGFSHKDILSHYFPNHKIVNAKKERYY